MALAMAMLMALTMAMLMAMLMALAMGMTMAMAMTTVIGETTMRVRMMGGSHNGVTKRKKTIGTMTKKRRIIRMMKIGLIGRLMVSILAIVAAIEDNFTKVADLAWDMRPSGPRRYRA